MHVPLHKIRRLSLLNYMYVWVRQLFVCLVFFFQRVGFKGIWYLKMWVGVSGCSGFWNEYRGLYWNFVIQSFVYQQLHNLIGFSFFSYFAQETTILQLQAPQLEFLLDDLSRKLQYSLSSSASSRRSFLKVSISIVSTRKLR